MSLHFHATNYVYYASGFPSDVVQLHSLKSQKRKGKSDQAKVCHTRVNLRLAFSRWGKICKIKSYNTDAKLAFSLLDYVVSYISWFAMSCIVALA